MALFTRFNQIGVTLLIASHDLALISTLPYRTLTLDQGRLVNDRHVAN
jgi:cell division transport system ATP-binding protein